MRRAPIVLTATVLGTAGVLLFKPLAPAPGVTAARAEAPPSGTDGTASAGTASATPQPTSSSGPSASSTVRNGEYTGDAETVRFGTTQVKVTISGGRITDVTVLEYNDDDPRSVSISESAFPTLRSEVLAKQTAAVDLVSGATYTSDQYEASLQSALDRAGFTAADGSKASTDVSNIQESGGGFGH